MLRFCWEESDHTGFEEEPRSLGGIFPSDFHFEVDYYAIPSEQIHVKLDTRIKLVLNECGHQDHLLIIHYGGMLTQTMMLGRRSWLFGQRKLPKQN